MEFMNCRKCRDYKYIKRDELCPSCFEEWLVVFRMPCLMCESEVMHEGLSEREAEEIADESRRMIARPAN